jgi:hypothetical protein
VYAHDVECNSVHHCCYELRNSLTILGTDTRYHMKQLVSKLED